MANSLFISTQYNLPHQQSLLISFDDIRHFVNNNPNRKRFCSTMKNKYSITYGRAIKTYRAIVGIIQFFENKNPNQKAFYKAMKHHLNISYGLSIRIYQYLLNLSAVEGQSIDPPIPSLINSADVIRYFQNIRPNRREFGRAMKNKYNVTYGAAIKIYGELSHRYKLQDDNINNEKIAVEGINILETNNYNDNNNKGGHDIDGD